MTPNAKRWIILDEQWLKNSAKAEKYESGYYYDPIRGAKWRVKADSARQKQNQLENKLTNADKNSIEEEYMVGGMFERD